MNRPLKIPSSLKSAVANFLCNPLVGKLLSQAFHHRIPNRDIVIDTSDASITPEITASIFFRLYEGAEIRFLHQFLKRDLDVIELGSSIGVLACHIRKLMSPQLKLICVEANPTLIPQIRNNLELNALYANVLIVNKAVAYGLLNTETVPFTPGKTNVAGQLSGDTIGENKKTLAIGATTLLELIQDNELGDYALVCDIEGAEAGLAFEDLAALKNCRQLIIELHQTIFRGKTIEVEDLFRMFSAVEGFKLAARYGSVCVFER